MFADTEAFGILLVFSVAVGAALGAFYDTVMLFVNSFFPEKSVKKKKTQLPHNAVLAEKALFPIEKRIFPRDIVVFFSDILFCTVSAFAVIVLLYHLNYGAVRVLSLAVAVFGFVLYRKTVGKPLLFVAEKTVALVKKIIFVLIKMIFVVLVKPVALPVFEKVNRIVVKKRAVGYIDKMLKNEEKRNAKRKSRNRRTQ